MELLDKKETFLKKKRSMKNDVFEKKSTIERIEKWKEEENMQHLIANYIRDRLPKNKKKLPWERLNRLIPTKVLSQINSHQQKIGPQLVSFNELIDDAFEDLKNEISNTVISSEVSESDMKINELFKKVLSNITLADFISDLSRKEFYNKNTRFIRDVIDHLQFLSINKEAVEFIQTKLFNTPAEQNIRVDDPDLRKFIDYEWMKKPAEEGVIVLDLEASINFLKIRGRL